MHEDTWAALYELARKSVQPLESGDGKVPRRIVLYPVYAALTQVLGFHPSWVRRGEIPKSISRRPDPRSILEKADALHQGVDGEGGSFLLVAAECTASEAYSRDIATLYGYCKHDLCGNESHFRTLNKEIDIESNSVMFGKKKIYIPGRAVRLPTWLLIGGC